MSPPLAHADAFQESVEFSELRTQLQACARLRRFYMDASVQLAGQNPKDTWKPSVADGKTPPFDPFEAAVPDNARYEVGAFPGRSRCGDPTPWLTPRGRGAVA